MSFIVKAVGSGIGLATEAVAARKASKAEAAANANANASGSRSPAQSPSEAPPGYKESQETAGFDGSDEENDEADWALDDEVAEQESEHNPAVGEELPIGPVPSGDKEKIAYVDKIVRTFIKQHPLPPAGAENLGRLPCSVIIPQRRPHTKARGFVRAYAPVLEDCGIDEATFLTFLKTLLTASKASPIFNIINIAAMIAGNIPSVAAMVTSMVVQAAAMTAIEIQGNQRTNSFLDQMNQQFFMPRGLYCMIVTYKPQEKASLERMDISQTITKSLTPSNKKLKQTVHNMGRSTAKTYGEMQMPEAAPLVFPALDAIAAVEGPGGKKQGKMKSKGKFIANYFDKRAQAAYTAENPDSALAQAQVEHKFASRYADPNHPANNGSIISLITGGVVSNSRRGGGSGIGRGPLAYVDIAKSLMNGGRGSSSDEAGHNPSRQDMQDARGAGRGRGRLGRGLLGSRRDRAGRGRLIGMIKKKLTPNVLYLMVVNMPTEKEMEAAKAQFSI